MSHLIHSFDALKLADGWTDGFARLSGVVGEDRVVLSDTVLVSWRARKNKAGQFRVEQKDVLRIDCTRSGIDGRIEFYDAGGEINFYVSLTSPIEQGETIDMTPRPRRKPKVG